MNRPQWSNTWVAVKELKIKLGFRVWGLGFRVAVKELKIKLP